MFGLLHKNTPLLDAEASAWIQAGFAWALENFDAEIFFDHTVLVLPTNQFFPGTVNSVEGMAQLIFERVKTYAGVSHWPTRVADQSSCSLLPQPRLQLSGPLRDPNGVEDQHLSPELRLVIPYNPQQINNPEGLIATYAHILAHYLGQMAKTPPPGGVDHWPHITELLAVYMGFGLMFANSAFTHRGGCGSCYNPNATRDAYLSEREATYALALFSVLKEIPNPAVTAHLKGHLKGFYKRAVKELSQQQTLLQRLRAC